MTSEQVNVTGVDEQPLDQPVPDRIFLLNGGDGILWSEDAEEGEPAVEYVRLASQRQGGERAQIVAHMRDAARRFGAGVTAATLNGFADFYERGEHLSTPVSESAKVGAGEVERLREKILRTRFPYVSQQDVNRPVTVHWFDVTLAIDKALSALSQPESAKNSALSEGEIAKVIAEHFEDGGGCVDGPDWEWNDRDAAKVIASCAAAIAALTDAQPEEGAQGKGEGL